MVVELKQSRFNRKSPVVKVLKNIGHHPYSISKYCIGVANLYQHLKYNLFKRKLLKITKKTYFFDIFSKHSTTFSKRKKWIFLGGKKFFSRQKYPHSMQNHKENQKKCEKSRFSAIFHTFFDFLCDFFHF